MLSGQTHEWIPYLPKAGTGIFWKSVNICALLALVSEIEDAFEIFFRVMGNSEALFLHRKSGMEDFDQFQNAQTEFADNIQVLGGVFINGMVGILPECNVQMPMHNLYGPMLAHSPTKKSNVFFQAADKVTVFYGHASVLPLRRFLFHANAFEVSPFGANVINLSRLWNGRRNEKRN